jgi:hypothetical protein
VYHKIKYICSIWSVQNFHQVPTVGHLLPYTTTSSLSLPAVGPSLSNSTTTLSDIDVWILMTILIKSQWISTYMMTKQMMILSNQMVVAHNVALRELKQI